MFSLDRSLCFCVTFFVTSGIVAAEEEIRLESGKNVRISCVTKDVGSGRCMWKTNRNDTIHSISHTKGTNRRLAIVGDVNRGDCSLLLLNVNSKDNGRWQCTFFPTTIKTFNVIIRDESVERLTTMFKHKLVNDMDKVIVDMMKDAQHRVNCIFDTKFHFPAFTWFVDDVGPQKASVKKETDEDTGETRYISTLAMSPYDILKGDENQVKAIRCSVSFLDQKNSRHTTMYIGTEHPVSKVELLYRGPRQVSETTTGFVHCSANGNPLPKPSEYIILFREGGNQKWEIGAQHPNMSVTTGGHYRCIAQNRPMLENNEWKASEDILIGGEVEMSFVLLYINSAGKIPCTSHHTSETCLWVKDNEIVAGSNIPTIQDQYAVIGKSTQGDCTLRIAEVAQRDEGVWRCHFFPAGRRVMRDITVLVM